MQTPRDIVVHSNDPKKHKHVVLTIHLPLVICYFHISNHLFVLSKGGRISKVILYKQIIILNRQFLILLLTWLPSKSLCLTFTVKPSDNVVGNLTFDCIIGAEGGSPGLPGFSRKEFRGKLALGITANFVNRHTREEAAVSEISGVAFIYNQSFFQELKESTGIDLENIVYYKDQTHYFVMTAKKDSLINRGVFKKVGSKTALLL